MARFKHVYVWKIFPALATNRRKPASPFTFVTLTSNLNPSLVANVALNTLLLYLDTIYFQGNNFLYGRG
jgi:hypothetical protein